MQPNDLSTPSPRTLPISLYYDHEAFGRFSETIARTIGTARFLVIQTVIVVGWITLNMISESWRFDRYPFILLTLALSLQAAYAAPLILLAQTRQSERDQDEFQTDRDRSERMDASLNYLARELASVRIAVVDAPTRHEMESMIEHAIRSALATEAGAAG